MQFSVFEVDITQEQLQRLLNRAGDVLDETEDSLRLYPICEGCRAKIEIVGQGTVTQDPDFIII